MALEPLIGATSPDCQVAGSVSRRFGSKERNDAQQSIQARIYLNPFDKLLTMLQSLRGLISGGAKRW